MKMNSTNCNFIDFIFDKIKKYKDAVAIIDDATKRKIKFSEIQPKAEIIARGLHEDGIKKGDVVAIVSFNMPEYIITIYALMRLGAIINFINPLLTEQEILQQLKDSNTKLIITNSIHFEICELAVKSGNLTLPIVHFNMLKKNVIGKLPNIKISGENELLIFWTTGTTGTPKGIIHTHKSFLTQYLLLDKQNDVGGIKYGDIFSCIIPIFSSYGFGVHIFGIMQGATAILTLKMTNLPKILQYYNVTVLHSIPTILNFLVKDSSLSLPFLREIIVCGNIKKNLISIVEKQLNVEVRQLYGTTECGIVSFQSYGNTKKHSVGKPLLGTLTKIIDKIGRHVNPREYGEMCIKGSNIAEKQLNSTKLIKDKEGFWHTGDIVTYDDDGDIFFIDRLKDIIKVKGHQVSPIELENIIIKNKKVADVAIIGIEDEEKGEAPKAFIVRNENIVNLTKYDVIDFVKSRVASYKNIVDVEFVDSIPKTSTGKILRRELK